MRKKVIFIVIYFTFTLVYACKPVIPSKENMILNADFIVVVDIEKIEVASISNDFLTYRQKATAKIVQVIKGSVEDEILILGSQQKKNTKICYEKYTKGKFLVGARLV